MAVDLINFLIDAFCLPQGSFIFLTGEADPQAELVLVIAEGPPPTHSTQHFQRSGPLPVNLAMARSDDYRREVWDSASTLMESGDGNVTEQRLLSAMRWCGRARASRSPAVAMLRYAIALETLLLDRRKSKVTERTTKRIASVVSTDPQRQLDVKSRAAKLYDIRSDIVHNGRLRVPFDQAALMRVYALRVALELLLDEEFRTCTSHALAESYLDSMWRGGET